MRPVQDAIAKLSINRCEGACRRLGQITRFVRLECEAREARNDLLGVRGVVGVSEDFDIFMETLKSMFGVLQTSVSRWQAK